MPVKGTSTAADLYEEVRKVVQISRVSDRWSQSMIEGNSGVSSRISSDVSNTNIAIS
jgi:hypothetical protein